MNRRTLLLLATLLTTTHAASAQEATPPAPTVTPAPATESAWYGWQTLLGDAATGAATGLLAATGNGTASMATFGIGFTFIPAIVHGVHRRPLVSLGDFLLRGAAATAAEGFVLFGRMQCTGGDSPYPSDNCPPAGDIAAAVAILAGASVLDAAAFSWETRPVTAGKEPAPQAFTLAPTFAVEKDRAVAGVVGRF
jgi:hypothetical protein